MLAPRHYESSTCRECRLPSRFFWHGERGEAVLGAMFPEEASASAVDSPPAAAGPAGLDLEATVARWRALAAESTAPPGAPSVSVEVPVIKGRWLIPCIESVLSQSLRLLAPLPPVGRGRRAFQDDPLPPGRGRTSADLGLLR